MKKVFRNDQRVLFINAAFSMPLKYFCVNLIKKGGKSLMKIS